MLIKAAINGSRTKEEHPAIPVSPLEQAEAVAASIAAGAGAIHLHVRSSDGHESLSPSDVADTLTIVRRRSPAVPIGISTGAWIVPDPGERLAAVSAWVELPDFVSLNFHEEGAVELAELLLSRGVGIEAGLCNVFAANQFTSSSVAARCLRILIEPQEQELEAALRTVSAIEAILHNAQIRLPRLLHGTENTAWPLMDQSIARGYDVRIGFEDTLTLYDGRIASSNAELVGEACLRLKTF